MNKIRVALIGGGYMAEEYLKAISDAVAIEVVGITTRKESSVSKLLAEYPTLEYFSSIKNLATASKPDYVIVAVNELSSEQVLLEACKYDWTIISEKPIGIDLISARRIQNHFESQGKEIFVALNRRMFTSSLELMRELKNSGPRFTQIFDQQYPVIASSQGWPKQVVATWNHANSIHMVDLLLQVNRGEIAELQRTRHKISEEAFIQKAVMTFSSGDVCEYTGIWNAPSPWKLSVQLRDQYFEMYPIEKLRMRTNKSYSFHEFPVSDWDIKFKPGLRMLIQQIELHHENEINSLTKLNSYMSSAELVQQIYE